MAQHLFLDTDIQVLIDVTRRNLFDEVDHLNDTAILSRSNEEWLKHFIDKYTISVPTLDTTKADRTYVDGQVPQYKSRIPILTTNKEFRVEFIRCTFPIRDSKLCSITSHAFTR